MLHIINTGVANIRSLQAAFDRLQQPWTLTEDADDIRQGEHVVLPGVGAFASAAESLDRLQLRETISERLANPDRATLCICLGMQLLCESSEESESAKGLGIIPARIERFSDAVAVPQLGWNRVTPADHHPAPYAAGEAYFANSFRLATAPPADWGYATTRYDGTFYSSLWRGRTLACQFHPELSGTWGQQVLANWLAGTPVNLETGASTC